MERRSPPSRRALTQATIAWAGLHLRRTLRRRGALLALVVLPIAAALLRWVADAPSASAARILLVYPTPLLALFFASGALREEIEDRTLTYPFTRPVPRSWLYYARLAAHLGPLLLAVVPSLALVAGDLGELVRFTLTAAAASLAYGAIFALFGALSRSASWIGLGFLIWEHGALRVPGFVQDLSLLTYVHGLAGVSVDIGFLGLLGADLPGVARALAVLLGVAVVATALGGRLVERREIALER
ncbi:MAG: hypothetical protein KC486_12730 [Myxococcales bacterium]|nr:hypothetical protein [Myxococcales bacterium]